MITLERPAPELAPAAPDEPQEPADLGAGPSHSGRLFTSLRTWRAGSAFRGRLTVILVLGSVLATMAGSAVVVDAAIAIGVQSKAVQLHQQWAVMRANGIPDSDLAPLEQEWVYSQKFKYLGVGTIFWSPGASAIVDRWESAAAAIYARSVRLNSSST